MVSPISGGYGAGNNLQPSPLNNGNSGSSSKVSSEPVKNSRQQATKAKAASAEKPKSSKGFWDNTKDFFKGIADSAKNLVKSLTKPSTWLLIGGAVLLTAVFPPAGILLVGLGLGVGGYQILKGTASGDYKKVGEGVFNVGITATGAALGGKTFASADKGLAAQGTAVAGKAGKFLASDVSTAGTIKDAAKLASTPINRMA